MPPDTHATEPIEQLLTALEMDYTQFQQEIDQAVRKAEKALIIAILNLYEKDLSDGYDHYTGDVDSLLERIADEILAALRSFDKTQDALTQDAALKVDQKKDNAT